MSERRNVLVFPGGTEIGLEIQRALFQCKDVCLYSAGLDVSNHAPYVFARHFLLPGVDDPAWIEGLNGVIEQHGIDVVYPAHDDVLVALAQHAPEIEARIVSSPLQTCLITRSKSRTYRHLAESVPVPMLYRNVAEVDEYPVFVKPDKGQGSRNTHVVAGGDDLARLMAMEENRDSIALEYLPGEEYTVDCFSDREAGLLFCAGRRRVRTRAGISMNSSPVHDGVFREYAEAISARLPLHGAWFFQVKKDRHGLYKLLEIGPRIAGTMALHRVQGVNFPLLSIYEQERIPIALLTNDVNVSVDRALINRYRHDVSYRAVYVDLDDTLILHDKVNVDLVRFLYQCVNRGIRLILLTRHTKDVDDTLRQYRLAGLFDEVHHVERPLCKSEYIHERDAIFIDDSFSERARVHAARGILTFDCSMLEMLIDDRE